MLRPTHGDRKFTANRTFAGREDERGVFDAAIRQSDTRELYKVLMWYGVGGQGKSTLLREFGRMVRSFNEAEKKARSGRGLALAIIDFDDERLKRIDSALYSIRLQLGQALGLSFLTFDAAFVSYYRKTRPGIDVAAEFPELFGGESEAFADLLDVLGDNLSMAVDLASIALPGAGLIYKWGTRLTGRLKTWWSTRGNKVLAGIENLTPDELLQKLPSFLGIDICDGITAKPSQRPVIILDTYEALWRERGQKDTLTDRRADAWVRLLVQDAPGALFVIAGRDRLRWEEIDEAWGTVTDSHLLGDLSDEDAERFLKAVPIVEDDVRKRVVESSEGLPFYLDLQVSQYEEMREAGQKPKPEAFGGTPSDILARFLEHLNDSDQAQLRLASYVNVINRPIMASLAEAFPGRAVNFSFDRMVARSAFTQVSEEAYTIHSLMQEELQLREREDNEPVFRQIHRHLFEFHNAWLLALSDEKMADSVTRKDAPIRFEAAFNHLFYTAPDEAVAWLLKYQGWLGRQEEWAVVERLCRRAISFLDSNRIEKNSELLLSLINISTAQFNLGQSHGSQSNLQRIIETADMIEAKAPLLLSVAYYNLGQIHRECGEFIQAKAFYAQSITSAGFSGEDHQYLYMTHAALGECLYLQGLFQDACTSFLAATRHAYLSDSSEAVSQALHFLAEAYQALGFYGAAIGLFHLSLSAQHFYPDAVENVNTQPYSAPAILSYELSPSPIVRSSLTLRYLERVSIGGLAGMFNKSVSPPLWVSEPHCDNFTATHASLRDAARRGDTLDISVVALSQLAEADQQERIEKIQLLLSLSPIGRLLTKSIDKGGVRVILFEGGGLDYGFDSVHKVLWICGPFSLIDEIPHSVALVSLHAYREIDQYLIGLSVDPSKSGFEKAVVLHTKALDCAVYVCKHLNNIPSTTASEYMSFLNEKACQLVAAVRDGRTNEELFDIYAEYSRAWSRS